MQSKSVRLCLLSSATVEISFNLPKLYLKKSMKKQLNFSNSIFRSMWKTEQLFKKFYKDVLLSLSIITCRHLSLIYHTQKYFIKAYYYLAKM